MSESTFWKLNSILLPYFASTKKRKRKRGKTPNGDINTSQKLSMAIRYFAGGSPQDLMASHGIGYSSVYDSVWEVVDAVNQCDQIAITFTSHEKQQQIASRFAQKSDVGFDNCVGCIDGILIWTNQPTKNVVEEVGLGPKKFLCGRKKKFGLNMQAICDDQRRFIDTEISHPASTSDYLAFSTSSICERLEKPGYLCLGMCIYGDNAYMNSPVMAIPLSVCQLVLRMHTIFSTLN